jgi:hypothetical protein
MKKLSLILCLLLSGCAYNSITVTTTGDVDVKSYVDKPVTIDALRGLAAGATVPLSMVP